MYHILIVEDDKSLNRGISFIFEKEGLQVDSVYCLKEAEQIIQKRQQEENPFQIILLDLNLPDGDGLDFCMGIRKLFQIPIIMLTARDLETDEVIGLESGADDYITKPFSLSVLKARVNALLRRNELIQDMKNEKIVCGSFTLDKEKNKVYKEEKEVEFSTTEFRLLRYFMENRGQVLSKEQILGAVWDTEGNFVDENTLPVNIRRIRMKIEDNPSEPHFIKTVHGMGYLWNG